jgi:uncharacterized OB-fold protein
MYTRSHSITRCAICACSIVELDDGTRATGQLLDDDPQLGKRIKTVIGVVRESSGKKIHGLQFVPV